MTVGETGVTLVGPAHPFRGGIAHHTAMLYRALESSRRVSRIGFVRLYPAAWFPGTTQLDRSEAAFEVPGERVIAPLNPISWLRAFWRLTRQPTELVIFQWWHPFFGPCLGCIGHLVRRFTRRRIVFICHNVTPHERHRADRALTRFALSCAHRLVVHAESQRKEVQRLLPRAEVACHPHPAYDQFQLRGLSQRQARDELAVDGRVLLFFGHVRAYKGLEYLLRALPEVLAEVEVTLVIAGEFYEPRAPYDDLIRSLGLTKCVRVVDRYIPNEEVEAYFAACDLVVCPYTSGGQSGVVQIAYSFDKPVICSAVGGLSDAVVDGKTGFVVNAADSQDLARAIRAFYRSPAREQFAERIAERSEQRSWESLVETICDV